MEMKVQVAILFVLAVVLIGVLSARPAPSGVQLANPASSYCVQQGYRVEIITAADGSQSGTCVGPNGSCDEWAFYRGECSIG